MASRRAKLAFLANHYRADFGKRAAVRRRDDQIKPPRIYRNDKREAVIDATIRVMSSWRNSIFEGEATCRHALRSSLCLDGYAWSRANAEAVAIVAEALCRMGAVRPKWEQGQREYTTSIHDCNWCGIALSGEMIKGQRKGRFCSDVCAQHALTWRDYDGSYATSETGMAAYRHLFRQKLPHKTCEHCLKDYQAFSCSPVAQKTQRYCSIECKSMASRVYEERACANCNRRYRPNGRSKGYCSLACARGDEFTKYCIVCGSEYRTSSHKSLYCKNACALKASRFRRKALGGGNVIPLTAELFDCLFHQIRQQAGRSEIIPARTLTAEIFDGWFAAA